MAKTAVVTGGGSGIGKAVALALAASEYQVVIAGRRRAKLEEVASEYANGRITPMTVDVRDASSVRGLFDAVSNTFGRLDLLFNNAGISAPGIPIEDITFEQWQAVVDTNLTGAFLCSQQAIRLMKAQQPRGGRIINNGSISAHSPRPNSAPYTATKHAITGLTKSIALDGRAFDIACGQIDIGNAATELTAPMEVGVMQPSGQVLPEPRMDVNDAARAVLFMASLPLDSNVQFMTVMATKMPFIGRG